MLALEAERTQRLKLFGEDTFFLLRTLEESFGIKFTEDDLVQAKSVGELADCLSKKLEQPVSRQCLSALVFYRLRRTFMSVFSTPRAKITPSTSLHELMPWKDRKRQWLGIQNHLNFVLPQLTWPLWLVALSLLIVGLVLALPGLARLGSFGSASVLLKIVAAICVWVPVLVLLSPLARTFPRSCETFGDLVKLTLARNYAKIASEHGASFEREVLQALRQLIAAEEGIDVKEISAETLFPEGLHIY